MRPFAFVVGLVGLAAAAGSGSQEESFELKLQEGKRNAFVKATLTNPTEVDYKVLYTASILDNEIPVKKASVWVGDEELMHHGIMPNINYNNLEETDFTVFPAGEDIELVWDLARFYDLSEGGLFNVSSEGMVGWAFMDSTALEGWVPYESNIIEIEVDGEDAAGRFEGPL